MSINDSFTSLDQDALLKQLDAFNPTHTSATNFAISPQTTSATNQMATPKQSAALAYAKQMAQLQQQAQQVNLTNQQLVNQQNYHQQNYNHSNAIYGGQGNVNLGMHPIGGQSYPPLGGMSAASGGDALKWPMTPEKMYEHEVEHAAKIYNQLSPKQEQVLREKYPTLASAWDHYAIVLKMCRSQEEMEKDDGA